METITRGYVPPNMEKNTKWARKCFEEWLFERNEHYPDEKCPEDILKKQDAEEIGKWFPIFIGEVRRSDGEDYPPRSIHQILSGLLRYMRTVDSNCPNFLDRRDPRFQRIQKACETVFRSLHKQGIGVDVRHTPIVSAEEEGMLWERKVLNVSSPKGLLRAVFFYVGKICCLRGGEEQRNLKKSQFTRYVENGSKNRSGGTAQLNLENKIVPIHAVPENCPRCLVFLLDLYFSKLPEFPAKDDVFYLRPKVKVPSSPGEPWFDCIPIGKNKLATLMKEMFVEAGFQEMKTNHSLRATGATTLFDAGLPEKIIQKNTGHRSLEALRKYERVSVEQELEYSRILTSLGQSSYRESSSVSIAPVKNEQDEGDGNAQKIFQPSFSRCSIGHISINYK